MAVVDIFNGDADGICALTQLRLSNPQESRLVTGVKRDISLLAKADIKADDQVTILDISLDKNRGALEQALEVGAQCLYIDHHFAGEVPEHDNLRVIINTAAETCTSMLVNKVVKGQFTEWAIVGAFGDNLNKPATALAESINLNPEQIESLKQLGIYINYNGYGAAIEDLHFPPAELFALVSKHNSPLEFMQQDQETFERLEQGYQTDMANAQAVEPIQDLPHAAVYRLPDQPWSRRVSGVFGNELANQDPDKAHAVLSESTNDTVMISVRAPLNNRVGADEICRQFPSGGGRKAAAGVNSLPETEIERFIETFSGYYADLK